MPNSRDIPDFRPGERPGAGRLSEIARSANKTQRAFNMREREDPQYPINVGHLLISAVEGVGHYTAKFLPFLEKSITPATAVSATEIGTVGEDVMAMLVSDIGAGASSISVSGGSVYAVGHLTNLATNEATPRRVVTIMGVAGGGAIPVRCAQTGGSAGNKTTKCSYTYTIKKLDNSTTIATSVAVAGNGNRSLNAAMTAGTYGMAFIDNDGTWKLMFVDETYTQTNCT